MSVRVAALPTTPAQRSIWLPGMSWLSAPALVLVGLVLAAVLTSLLRPGAAEQIDLLRVSQPPGADHWWGQDELGRDVLARTLAGGRISLSVAAGATVVAIFLGAALGGVAALGGGWWDRLLSRLFDFLLAVPSIPLLIVLQSAAPGGIGAMIVVLGLLRCAEIGRLARATCLGTLGQEFVLAAHASGVGPLRLLLRHLLPHTAPVLLVAGSTAFATALLAESTLSFLGLGLPPEQPSWGTMLNSAQSSALGGAWWSALFPGLAIAVAVAAANALGDQLQDRLDPYQRARFSRGHRAHATGDA